MVHIDLNRNFISSVVKALILLESTLFLYKFRSISYYKFIFPDRRIHKLKIWFVLHRPIMLSVFLLAIIGLLVILAHKNWKWVSQSSLTQFVHSIFGMVTLGLAFIQVSSKKKLKSYSIFILSC